MVTEKKYYTQTDTQSINNINECWAVTTDNTSCLWCDKKMKAISRIKPQKIEKKRLAERFNSSFTSTSCTPTVLDCHPMIQPFIPLNSLNSHLLYNVSRLYPRQRAEAVICTKKSFLQRHGRGARATCIPRALHTSNSQSQYSSLTEA